MGIIKLSLRAIIGVVAGYVLAFILNYEIGLVISSWVGRLGPPIAYIPVFAALATFGVCTRLEVMYSDGH